MTQHNHPEHGIIQVDMGNHWIVWNWHRHGWDIIGSKMTDSKKDQRKELLEVALSVLTAENVRLGHTWLRLKMKQAFHKQHLKE